MKLPRDVPADRLITVPRHNPLKTGTLHAILAEVAQMRSTTIAGIAEML